MNRFQEEQNFNSLPRTLLLWASCFLVLYIFFGLIPMPWRSDHSILLAVVGGFIFLLVYALFIYSFELPVNGQWRDVLSTLKGLSVVASIFVFGYFMIRTTVDFETEELDKNGIQTVGAVSNRYWIPGKGSVSYHIVLSYKDQPGQNHTADIAVSKKHYNLLSVGNQVEVVYSKNYPELARISSYPTGRYSGYLFDEDDPLRQLEEKARKMKMERDSALQDRQDSLRQIPATGL